MSNKTNNTNNKYPFILKTDKEYILIISATNNYHFKFSDSAENSEIILQKSPIELSKIELSKFNILYENEDEYEFTFNILFKLIKPADPHNLRSTAMEWWNNLNNTKKEHYLRSTSKHIISADTRKLESLTGSEIEKIWKITNSLLKEEWKPLYDLKNYEISNFGNIKSLPRYIACGPNANGRRLVGGKILAKRTNGINPQLFTTIPHPSKKHSTISMYCAKAMMDHFKPKPSKKHLYVTPVDGDHTNIHPYNFKWITASDSIKNQPNRDNKKSWKTRKKLYGKRGTLIENSEIVKKRMQSIRKFRVTVLTGQIIKICNDVRKQNLEINILGKYSIVTGSKKNIYYNFLRKFNITGYSNKIEKI